MKSLIPFKYQTQRIRTQIDYDGNAWFVAWGKRPVARTRFGKELAGLGFP